MPTDRVIQVLFTGYAPVHFVCFRPLYERLVHSPRFDIYLSGGVRSESDTAGLLHDADALYKPFDVPRDHVLTVEQIRQRDFDALFGANTNLISPRSVTTRVQIFHGISFRNKAVREDNLGCDFYFMVGPYMQRKFADAGLLPLDDPRALRIGFMKTDALRNGALSRERLLAQHGLAGDRPVVLYAPTGQKFNSMDTMGEDVIRRLKAVDKYDLLIKLHDHPKDDRIDWPTRLQALEDEHTKVARDADVIPLLFLADLLVTDASSVSSEYSLMNRPMVFLDVPKLLRKARKGGAMDTETWGRRCGDIVERPEDVERAIELALAEPNRHADIRRAMSDDLFYNPGNATGAAMKWLETYFSAHPTITSPTLSS
ncbi:hypothetical protein BH09PLA1_BH09PLA1_25820 [soil metagenome]